MGVLKLRDLSEIHDNSYCLGSAGNTIVTHINHQPQEFQGLVSVRDYQNYGCCTSFASRCKNSSIKYENSFIGLPIKMFPSSYKNLELVTEWVSFMNNLFPFFDIQMISDFNGKVIDKNYWKTQGLRFTIREENIYFVIKKDITKNKYFALFQLSLLRYFVSSEYYFMIYDCLRLRKLDKLSHLSNWQIMDIARFGVQINKHQFNSQKQYDCYQYAFLRDYRSPIYNSIFIKSLNDEKRVLQLLNDGNTQNHSCHTNYLNLNVIYLMKLFEDEKYEELYSLITNDKYIVNENKIIELIKKEFNSNTNFNEINNLTFDFEEYEKTL